MQKYAWLPDSEIQKKSNITRMMTDLKMTEFGDLYRWSVKNRQQFWQKVVQYLKIVSKKESQEFLNLSLGVEKSQWFFGGKLNIADSCFNTDDDKTAVIYTSESGSISQLNYGDLKKFSSQVANGLLALGFRKGDAIAIAMPMNTESVAIYLGIVLAGMVVVSIADSFAPEEIATRLRISKAKAVFTQDYIYRGGKTLPLYEKVVAAGADKIIVLGENVPHLRHQDILWLSFLSKESQFTSVTCDPDDPINILFSSGTTGDPKAIPWTHTTPIKCASDGFFHHDIHEYDVVAWPTNLGWMMGPWLIFATLINRATIALFGGAPTGREFGEFVQNAKVTVLGVVPSIVKAWRASDCMQGLDWSSLKLFSSTGECSNADDYQFLMSLAGNKPVIEYCGGTEIGGGYLTGTVLQPAIPATFTTPALGLSFYILDEDNKPCDNGELFLVPPSIGLSTKLLNKDHHEVYYEGTPIGPEGELLRRHGDQVEQLENGYYRAHGRADDTMNLGGIKVSSAEIERVLNGVNGVSETAAVAINPPGGGPSWLVIFAVLNKSNNMDKSSLREPMQKAIREKLNPLFKIHDVVILDSLPRTASNKVMRRVLRSQYV